MHKRLYKDVAYTMNYPVLQARNTQISTHAVISRGTLSISQAAQGSLPSLQTIKKYVQRISNRDNSILSNPQTLSQLIISDIYKVSMSREVFLIHDNNSQRRTSVFASVRFIDALKNSEFWHCDGTFNVVPSIFTQLFTIYVMIGNTVIPAEEVFAIIRGVVDGYQSCSILMDFEMSMINAARNIFSDSSIKGCFESAVVLRRYKNEPVFCLNIKTLIAPPFLPPSDVIVGFETLRSYNISRIISRTIGLDETDTTTLEEMLDFQSICETLCKQSWTDKQEQTTPLKGGKALSQNLWDRAIQIFGFF
ncbi:hypothetical protein RF11_01897 [Thelohanellus kitauei]|uniref:MULE transposase domain-containing protein n=1 Tax=Thelohanellus kitauei TaxID=669202 RepID=A0A0C2MHR6_THEKT|nr:hypothetical protein RF11_01897 [Thelohanellus kitauei]